MSQADAAAPGRGRTRALRMLAGAWLVVAALAIAALSAELWLRIDRRASIQASERFRESNVFFANVPELNAGDHSLWQTRWSEYRPGARLDVTKGGQRFQVEINSRGYRTHEFAVPKPKGLVRIICIGGSTTVAGRTNDETYPALLEAKLRERFPGLPLEVLNLGVSSVTTEYWRERMDEVLADEPDILVQYQAINDISWRHLRHYADDHPWRRRAYGSLLLRHLLPLPVGELEPYLRGSFESMGAIADRCRARGVAYVTASFAAPDPARASGDFRRHLDYNAEFWTRRMPINSYATYARLIALHNRLLGDFARRRHLPHVLVHQQIDDPALFIDACHFTPEGIERLADAFLPTLVETLRSTATYREWAAR